MASYIDEKSIAIMVDNIKRIHSNMKSIVYYSFCIVFLSFCTIKLNGYVFRELLHSLELDNPPVRLDSITITSLETEGVNLTATFDLTFKFNSPNSNPQQNVSYNDLEVIIWWSGKENNQNITLAKAFLPPVTKVAHNLTMIRHKLNVSDEFYNGTDVINGIAAERDGGYVHIGVSMSGVSSVKDGDSEAVRFDLGPVPVEFTHGCNNGTYKWSIPAPIFLYSIVL